MSLSPVDLTSQLTAVVTQQFNFHAAPNGRTPQRLVAKTLRHLAKQLRKAAWQAAHPSAKQLRRALSSQLTTALAPLLNLEIPAGGAVAKAIDKTTKRLATRLVKLQRKQDKQAAKVNHWAGSVPIAGPPSLPTKEATPAPVAHKAAAHKRPTVKLPTHLVDLNANGIDGLTGLVD